MMLIYHGAILHYEMKWNILIFISASFKFKSLSRGLAKTQTYIQRLLLSNHLVCICLIDNIEVLLIAQMIYYIRSSITHDANMCYICESR